MALFDQRAPAIMAGLIRDLAITDVQAGGVLGNIGWECAGFTKLHQVGGNAVGWVQWDGARKIAFLAYCRQKNLDWQSDEANYSYLVRELQTSERSALNALKRTSTFVEASDVFEKSFERAGKPALEGRQEYARRAMLAWGDSDKRPIVFAGPQVSDQPVIPTGPPPTLSPRPPPAGDGLGEPIETDPPSNEGFLMRLLRSILDALFPKGT